MFLNEPERTLSKLIRVIGTWRGKRLNLAPFSKSMALETSVLRHGIHLEMSLAKKIAGKSTRREDQIYLCDPTSDECAKNWKVK